MSEAAAFAYATALNGLLASSRTDAKGRPVYPNRVMLGETAVAFWAEHDDAESLARAMIGGLRPRMTRRDDSGDALPVDERGETRNSATCCAEWRKGARCGKRRPTCIPSRASMCSASAPMRRGCRCASGWSSRSRRSRATSSFTGQDLSLEPKPHPWPPPLWRLLLELAPQRESKNIPPHLSGEMMRAILTGLPYPRALLIQTIMRIRADGDVNAAARRAWPRLS